MQMKCEARNRALRWIVGHDTGLSSIAIWRHMMGIGKRSDCWNHPSDPADLSRCIGLLNTMPEWRKRIMEMKSRSRYWRALVKRWDAVVACMEDEVGWDWRKGTIARQTYDFMKKIYADADARKH
jgi:hypothetical protein